MVLVKDNKSNLVHHSLLSQHCQLPSAANWLSCCVLQLANKLNSAVKAQERGPLDVYVQVNTSGEESKYGVEPQDCVSLAEHVHKECDLLRFAGLMTIGQKDYSSRPEDFEVRQTLTLHRTPGTSKFESYWTLVHYFSFDPNPRLSGVTTYWNWSHSENHPLQFDTGYRPVQDICGCDGYACTFRWEGALHVMAWQLHMHLGLCTQQMCIESF